MKTSKDITTPIGFFNTYFDLLPQYKTNKDAFDYLNTQVEYITGRKLFKNYEQWQNSQ
ncbi:hypothetical protein M0G43_01665 [Subsaxibacter sp. CAU 1640]|uniref:hypothetical protein n=1 Tax=Subsaxibacter sp. CAU 1640 TaxID=2933271 RepID=UPI002004971C|nr:hypothetical protein [Subsaxibacter sp. CAU 1640]MCK7589272.1 hypothetical protein [Subsaxibacter sp. CAU 1640]